MAERRCEDPHCNKVMAAGEIRQTDPGTGLLVCPSCLNNPNRSQMSATASMVALAHDGGDGRVINHCPFCGSGGVVGGSTGTVECTFCNSHFTVQVQPKHINSPQTVNGQPVHIPGMPDESEIGAPVPGAEPVTGTPPEGEAAPTVPGISDADLEEEMFATAEGHLLDRRSYAQYLAVRAARDEEERQAVLAQIRQANIRHVVAAKAREQMGLDDR
jgi:hypothetical protein